MNLKWKVLFGRNPHVDSVMDEFEHGSENGVCHNKTFAAFLEPLGVSLYQWQ